ncbi:UDP-glucose 4-epimerase GalE, partial [bacterium]|nr:UDP-glucose 4-epimerase GalE [bacterium]
MKRVFVTGGAGYIGTHACVELLKSGHEVFVYDNLNTGFFEALERIKIITNKSFGFLKADIRDKNTLLGALVKFNPDVVLHFAGLKAVNDSIKDPLAYYDVNVVGSLNLLEAINASNCKNIIFSSSATVYGEAKYLPYDEKHSANPVNPYGKTKFTVEQILGDWVISHQGCKAVCLRYFNPVGAHESGLIGEDSQSVPNNLMPFILQVAAGRRKYLSIFGDDYATRDGTGERDFVHVVDLAQGHVKIVDKLNGLKDFEIFNFGTGSGSTVKELVSIFEKVSGKKIKLKIERRRAGDIAISYTDPTLAKKVLGISFDRTLEDMCI